jgi:branched-chain amino acid aminotransferase
MIYVNGEILAEDEVRLSPADRGLLLGDGLFETFRAYRGRVAFARQHLDRLARGAAELDIPLPWSPAALVDALHAVLEANRHLHLEAALRLTLTRGPGPRGLSPPPVPRPTLLISSTPLLHPSSTQVRAALATPRRNEHSPLARIKSLNYLDNILALREAQARGLDEALLLNSAGRLACATAANLFLVLDGGLLTPPERDGALPGITREAVLRISERLGLSASVRSLAPGDLLTAQEAFLTNTLIELCPLVELDGQPIGTGAPGPITARLLEAFREMAPAM